MSITNETGDLLIVSFPDRPEAMPIVLQPGDHLKFDVLVIEVRKAYAAHFERAS